MASDQDLNSKRTRVEPVFRWLRDHGPADWPRTLVETAHGLAVAIDPGPVVAVAFESPFRAHPERLAWMVRNAERLLPRDVEAWRALQTRVVEHPERAAALDQLEAGGSAGRRFTLEGSTHADCLIECERAVIWIEGKRRDWLAPGTKWDVTRDQLARNLEAAWRHASALGKEYCLVICHEEELRHHEQLLVDGYRAGTWAGGWPHVDRAQRRELGRRIGTLRWGAILGTWPRMRSVLALHDVLP